MDSDESSTIFTTLKRLPNLSTNIEDLTISSKQAETCFPPTLVQVLTSLTKLEALRIIELPVTAALFVSLSALPNHTTLEVVVMGNTKSLSASSAGTSVKIAFHTL